MITSGRNAMRVQSLDGDSDILVKSERRIPSGGGIYLYRKRFSDIPGFF